LVRTARRQLRAYVFVSSAKVTNVIDDDGMPKAVVVIKNSGQTPAYDLLNATGFTANTYPSLPTLKLTIADEDFSISKTRISLGPKDTSISITTADRKLTEQQWASIADGTGAVYVYGEIRYRDVFGKNQRTRYRLMMGGAVGVSGGQLTGCEEGNEAT